MFIIFQKLLPKHFLSRCLGKLAHGRCSIFKNIAILVFIKYFGVDLSESEITDIKQFSSFNEFFIRQLKPGIRPLPSGIHAVACPADGRISELGKIAGGQLLQAKGHYYELSELLGGDPPLAETFADGHFATIYLAPRDYHRVHMPVSGKLQQMIYVPGQLFSVNQQTVKEVPRVFSRNERVICIFETAFGPMAMILVGALLIGSVVTKWEGQVMPRRSRKIFRKKYFESIVLKRGEEMGYFQWGSTVIVLFAKDAVAWSDLRAEVNVQMGQTIGKALEDKTYDA